MTTRVFKNFVLVLLLGLLSGKAGAQFVKAEIGVNGLTCSQCSRSVEMQLRKLPFVKEVQMDLEHPQSTVTFREGSKVDVAALARAVRDAGFSVRFLNASIDMQHITIGEDHSFRINNAVYAILNNAPVSRGITVFRFTGRQFSDKKEKAEARLPRDKSNKTVYGVIAGA